MTIATWVNSDREVIDEEIENSLELYSDEFSKRMLAMPQFRQQLIAYVINRVELARRDINNRHTSLSKTRCPYHSLEFRLCIERYITEGIAHLLHVNFDILEDYIPRESSLSFAF
jgi:hypothetical protein